MMPARSAAPPGVQPGKKAQEKAQREGQGIVEASPGGPAGKLLQPVGAKLQAHGEEEEEKPQGGEGFQLLHGGDGGP
jgi:hypothetical protein